jgi:polar amino acid transport system substrate-binding protein
LGLGMVIVYGSHAVFIMKKLAFLTLFSLILFFQSGVEAAQRTIKIVYFENFPPYSWLEHGKMRGMLIDVVTEAIEKRMGIKVEHEGYPWGRAQQMVKNGEADAFITIPTPERLEYTIASREPVVIATFKPFTWAGNPIIPEVSKARKLSDLKKYKHGTYIGAGWARQKLAGMDVEWFANLDVCLTALKAGRFDLIIDSIHVVRYNIKKLGFRSDIVEIPWVVERVPWTLCVGKQSDMALRMAEFEKTMKAMRKDGSWRKIINRY